MQSNRVNIAPNYQKVLENGKTPWQDDMKRVFAFQRGEIELEKRTIKGADGRHRQAHFYGTPTLSLVKPNAQFAERINSQPVQDTDKYLYEAEADNLKAHCDMIDIEKLNYTKPVFIVYNPNSGRRLDFTGMIKRELESAGIPYFLYPTKGPRDSFVIAKNFNIDDYSAIGACGGDGTVQEVIDGMLKRADKKKIPFWVIPHGSGNLFAFNLRIINLDRSIEALKKGHVIKMDTYQALIDYNSKEEIEKAGVDMDKHFVNGVLLSGYGIFSEMMNATPLQKWIIGPIAYMY